MPEQTGGCDPLVIWRAELMNFVPLLHRHNPTAQPNDSRQWKDNVRRRVAAPAPTAIQYHGRLLLMSGDMKWAR